MEDWEYNDREYELARNTINNKRIGITAQVGENRGYKTKSTESAYKYIKNSDTRKTLIALTALNRGLIKNAKRINGQRRISTFLPKRVGRKRQVKQNTKEEYEKRTREITITDCQE